MDAVVIAVLIVVVLAVLFGRSRVASRRAVQDAEFGNAGMWGMSWLPTWLILGGMSGHQGDATDGGTDSSSAGATDSFGDVFGGGGGGGDFGAGGGGDFGGGSP